MRNLFQVSILALGFMLSSCNDDNTYNEDTLTDQQLRAKEAFQLLSISSTEGSRQIYEPGKGVKFRAQDSVYVKSALGIKLTKEDATVTLPLFKGIAPDGKFVYYIITESSDYETAKQMGINYAPKLINAIGSGGEQYVTLENGHMKFKGSVDFSPVHSVVAGADIFPPATANPGARGNSEWSSIVVLPSGQVLNAQIVSNDSGNHDRLKDIDKTKMSVTLSILNGFREGKEYFFHLVTDATADLPAALEKGVSAPKLAKIPAFGKSLPSDKSAFLGFSPNANGLTTTGGQGFAYSIKNGGIDPINVFPLAPKNEDSSKGNNYSPLWDAHVSKWTQKAFDEGKVRRITSIADQKMLIDQGYITSLQDSQAINVNQFTGLKPVELMINCPVIAHPSSVN